MYDAVVELTGGFVATVVVWVEVVVVKVVVVAMVVVEEVVTKKFMPVTVAA